MIKSNDFKWCKWCQKKLVKRPEEDPYYFKRRKYCNKSCASWHREAIRRKK